MAVPEHVALARSGPSAIARWREINFMVPNERLMLYSLKGHSLGDRSAGETFEPEFIVGRAKLDLSGAFLSGVKLPRADLAHDNLSGADLTGCNLRLAELAGANLQAAFLSRSDLSNAIFTRANMAGCSLVRSNLASSVFQMAEMRGADLSNSNLRYANLEGADLSETDLSSADLSWSNLTRANLRGAHLTATSLNLADLTGADLRGAFITKADLESAIFFNTRLGMTKFVNCDLSQIIGLDSANHTGPSTISLDTLAKSRGSLPRRFLENAGIAGPLIEAQDALKGMRRAYPTVLIVAATRDKEFTGRLRSGLADSQIPSWVVAADDDEAVRSGEILLKDTIYYDRLVLVCSTESLESDQASQYLAELAGRQKSEANPTLVTLATDELFFHREDRLCDTLKQGSVVDFQGWEDPPKYQEALSSLVSLLSKAP